MDDIGNLILNYGGTVIMAVLFVWVFITDKTHNTQLLDEIKEMVKSIKMSNENISKTLELLQNNCETLDDKIDRNYEYMALELKEIEKKGGENE